MFSASLIHIIPDSLKGFFFEKRLLFRAVRGYWLCYAMYHDTLIAYAFLKKNYLLKYRFMHRKDVLISPYYVSPEYRGHRLGGELLNVALSSDRFVWRKAFALVMPKRKGGRLKSEADTPASTDDGHDEDSDREDGEEEEELEGREEGEGRGSTGTLDPSNEDAG